MFFVIVGVVIMFDKYSIRLSILPLYVIKILMEIIIDDNMVNLV